MVRNYTRKSQRAKQYTTEALEHALKEVKSGTSTIYRAHKKYNIPKTTLFYQMKRVRGKISRTQGRAPAIPLEDEERLAIALKIMKKWDFEITRKEVLRIVSEYVITNNIKTPFKNSFPGEDWFLRFKSRHRLSIKKPQSVEYARKKMTDPFVIYEYFDILEEAIKDNELSLKPELLWNLDESSFSLDPKKSKVVGARGQPSSRTTSGPGRENTTIPSAISASGLKAPPLIVFKGKHIWDSWIADERNSFKGMAYAASAKVLGQERPILLIYDGQSTHMNVKLVELARDNDIIILKLPPHTSHLSQPLDLAVSKSLKDAWDRELVMWQRQDIGLEIPKKKFSELLGSVWKNLHSDVIEVFDPESLRRWEDGRNKQGSVEPVPSTSNYQAIIHTISINEQTDIISSAPTAHNTVIERSDSTVEIHPKYSFEQLLLRTVKQTTTPRSSKRKRVANGAEVTTHPEVIQRLIDEEKERLTKSKNETQKRPKKRNNGIKEVVPKKVSKKRKIPYKYKQ
nr:uncharacterized protein LOC111509902 [Leptinotarsa decemlineata]